MPSSPWFALVAEVHGHRRTQSLAGRILAASEQQLAQRPDRRTQHDVVDRAAKCRTDRLQLIKLDMDGRDPPRRADRHVQARVRRRDQLVTDEQIHYRPRALQRLTRMDQRVRADASCSDAGAGRLADRLKSNGEAIRAGPRRMTNTGAAWGAVVSRGAGSESSSRSTMPTEPTPSTRQ